MLRQCQNNTLSMVAPRVRSLIAMPNPPNYFDKKCIETNKENLCEDHTKLANLLALLLCHLRRVITFEKFSLKDTKYINNCPRIMSNKHNKCLGMHCLQFVGRYFNSQFLRYQISFKILGNLAWILRV